MRNLFKMLVFFAILSVSIFAETKNSDLDIQGTWLSAGDNIAPLLQLIFQDNVDSIYATFNNNSTYLVRQVNKDQTEIIYEGVYSVAESGVGNIYTITLEQSLPSVATSEGIFEIDLTVSPDFMQYEVVQTSGTQNVPPTPAAGFGSSNGGVLGTTNVQKYERILGGVNADDDILDTWVSTGENIAPLLQTIFQNNVDSIYATFETNQTYYVKQINLDQTIIEYSGSYVINPSQTGNIYTIVLEQNIPAVATSEGIFEIDLDVFPNFMQYEVVQTSGTQNVPPTPEAGFGSSNGGTLGTLNVQKYVRYYPITTGIRELNDVLPVNFDLSQNYPNPFNPTTKIRFSLPEATDVKLVVYNLLGEEIAELVNSSFNSGIYEIDFSAEGLASGIYIYSLKTNNVVLTKKMTVLK